MSKGNLNTRFTIHINGKKQELHFLGKEYENDVVKTYIEIKNTPLSSLKASRLNQIYFMIFFRNNKTLSILTLIIAKKLLINER